MPLYMDIHLAPGATARDVAEAHSKDLLLQDEHQCKCMTYWIDEEKGNIFCLIDAPTKEAVSVLHEASHGMSPNKVIEVSADVVAAFLGRIYDPADAQTSEDGLKVFEDPSFRILLVTRTTDPILLRHQLGKEKVNELLSLKNDVVRKNLIRFQGREVEHEGDGFIASFTSAVKALSCALAIHEELSPEVSGSLGVRIGINGGEPVQKADSIFGDTIQFARQICSIGKDRRVAVTAAINDLVSKDLVKERASHVMSLPPQDEMVLESLFDVLRENWQDADFNVDKFAKAMAMSSSQLYRKTVELCDMSPNALIREFKLEKAKDLMKKRQYNISQITFDAGFASPSYFTKCFKTRYGLLPMAYIDLLH